MTDDKTCSTTCALPTSDAELRKLLTPEQYRIVRQNGTERPFQNAYWDNHADGIYVDVVSGDPLFSSKDKFDSGTGWPSFTRPIAPDVLKKQSDESHGMVRDEVRSARADSHLGHVFDDGPAPTGLRYCINSGALRFVPVDELEKNGLGQYLPVFGRTAPSKASSSAPADKEAKTQVAIFAAGCFWGVEEEFMKTPGVKGTKVGYIGGAKPNPTYKEVCTDRTGHAEAVRVEFDPSVVSYEALVEKFFELHDPTQLNRQGPDVGSQYRSGIFTTAPEQEAVAQSVKERVAKSGRFRRPVVTEIVVAPEFYPAEEYHQQYLRKNGLSNCHF